MHELSSVLRFMLRLHFVHYALRYALFYSDDGAQSKSLHMLAIVALRALRSVLRAVLLRML